mmetsp:Transcript_83700/g.210965  ORF Transcript_83700/g.210965 Transcript_83700/m.210965 type:complete len:271 (+) Transcript_83700:1619-2431(+)
MTKIRFPARCRLAAAASWGAPSDQTGDSDLRKYLSKSTYSMRRLPPAIVSKAALTLSKLLSSPMTRLPSSPGNMKLATSLSFCTAASNSSLETEPFPSASKRRNMACNSGVPRAPCAAARCRKYAANSANATRGRPPDMAPKIASTASKLCSSLMGEGAVSSSWRPWKTKFQILRSLYTASTSSSFDTEPLPSASMTPKQTRQACSSNAPAASPPVGCTQPGTLTDDARALLPPRLLLLRNGVGAALKAWLPGDPARSAPLSAWLIEDDR